MAGADHVGELCLPLISEKLVGNEKLKKVKVKISGILTSRMTLESPWGVCADSRVPQRSPCFHCSMIVNWIPHIVKIVSKSKYLTSPTIIEIIKHLGTIKYCTSYFASSQAVHGSTTGGVAMGLSSLWISFVVYCYHRTVILVNKFFSIFV